MTDNIKLPNECGFEQWYVTNAFDYPANPLGSNECGLQRKAWHAAIAAHDEELRGKGTRGQIAQWRDDSRTLAELRKQEPYAFVTGGTIKDECNSDCFYECDHHCPPCPLAAPIPPTIPDGWQLVPKVGTQGCMPCSDGDKPPHDAEPVKDDEWVQCYLYTLLDEAKRRGGMFPQTSEEQDDDSKAIFCVADMVRFYGQQGYPKQDAIAKLQALRASNFSQQGRRNDG